MSNSERISIPFFFMGPSSEVIDPSDLCPDEEPKYPTISWRQFQLGRLASFKECKDRIPNDDKTE